MPYQRPELADLRDNAYAAIEAIPGADARMRFAVLNALAIMTAGAADSLYGFQEWIAKQILPDKAEKEFLDRHASMWLQGGRKPAAAASGLLVVPGANDTVVPAGTAFIRSDGMQYVATNEVTVADGTASVPVQASAAGLSTNAVAGQAMTLVSPVPGLQSSATVGVAGLSGGAEVERDDELRARLLQRLSQPPNGGSQSDYVRWALEVAGVTRAWAYPGEVGLGTVTVRFVRDNDASIIPDANEVTAVREHIDSLRPVTAEVYVAAPIEMPVPFTIQITPTTAAVKAAVEAELRDLIVREGTPGGAILVSHIREAISLAAGEVDHTLQSPSANVVASGGQLATFGGITWV